MTYIQLTHATSKGHKRNKIQTFIDIDTLNINIYIHRIFVYCIQTTLKQCELQIFDP